MMNKIARYLFLFSLVLMAWWVFFWPFVFSDEAHLVFVKVGALTTLFLFFVTLITLILIRIKRFISEHPVTSD
ncbi:MAG: hypothetical protein EP297_08130 [Gammaproteobacteria bacterium]|nr:MAG: hypothetical protein EP297_08130 [Gammaproteobacteria bacterium]